MKKPKKSLFIIARQGKPLDFFYPTLKSAQLDSYDEDVYKYDEDVYEVEVILKKRWKKDEWTEVPLKTKRSSKE